MYSLTPPSLRKRYYLIFTLMSAAILTTLGGYIVYTYHSFHKNLKYKLENSASSIMEELERGFDDNQAFLKYLGEIISKNYDEYDLESISNLLTSTGDFNMRSLATSYVGWANKAGYIVVSGRHGILKEKDAPNIAKRRYFETAKAQPWVLKFSEISKSLFSTNRVLPSTMGVLNKAGEFSGYLTLGIRLKQLTDQLKKISNDPDIYFLILDSDFNLAVNSIDLLSDTYDQDSYFLRKQLDQNKFNDFSFPKTDIEFAVVKKFNRYPFLILTGYSKSKFFKDLTKELVPILLEFLMMTILVVLLLNLFKRKIIAPINKLYESCLQLSKGQAVQTFPHFNIQELDKLSEGLKVLSVLFAAYEKDKIKTEEENKIASTSDKAREKHLTEVYQTLNQYLTEIRLCILGLKEISSLDRNELAHKLLEELDKKSDDVLNATFSDEEKTFFDINTLLTECRMIYLKEAFKSSITIEINNTHLPPYYGNKFKLKQILLSIIGKCFQSLPEEGHIHIKTDTFVDQDETYIQLSIKDNGFSEKTVQHIERTIEINKKVQLIGLTILNLEKVQQMIQEEGGFLQILPRSVGREYVLTLSTTYLNFPEQQKNLQNNVIRFNIKKNNLLS